jgi:hypothetical protein
MRSALDSYVVEVLLAIHSPWRRASAVARRLRRFTVAAFDPYRPELHYMRVPGPKSREKIRRSDGRIAAAIGEARGKGGEVVPIRKPAG